MQYSCRSYTVCNGPGAKAGRPWMSDALLCPVGFSQHTCYRDAQATGDTQARPGAPDGPDVAAGVLWVLSGTIVTSGSAIGTVALG